MSKEAVVWSLPNCVQCNRTMKWLEDKEVPYTVLDLTDPDHSDDLNEFKMAGHSSAPIVEVVDIADEYGLLNQLDIWSGFQPEKLVEHFA